MWLRNGIGVDGEKKIEVVDRLVRGNCFLTIGFGIPSSKVISNIELIMYKFKNVWVRTIDRDNKRQQYYKCNDVISHIIILESIPIALVRRPKIASSFYACSHLKISINECKRQK